MSVHKGSNTVLQCTCRPSQINSGYVFNRQIPLISHGSPSPRDRHHTCFRCMLNSQKNQPKLFFFYPRIYNQIGCASICGSFHLDHWVIGKLWDCSCKNEWPRILIQSDLLRISHWIYYWPWWGGLKPASIFCRDSRQRESQITITSLCHIKYSSRANHSAEYHWLSTPLVAHIGSQKLKRKSVATAHVDNRSLLHQWSFIFLHPCSASHFETTMFQRAVLIYQILGEAKY